MDNVTLGAAIAIAKNNSGGGGGGGSGVLVVHTDMSTGTATLDKTWKEINDAGFSIIYNGVNSGGVSLYNGSFIEGEMYGLRYTDLQEDETVYFVATSEDGYPVFYTPAI